MVLAVLALAAAAPRLSPRATPSTSRVGAPPRLLSSSVFDSAGWAPLQASLDALPVFAVANAEGQPLTFSLPAEGGARAIFYVDVRAAKAALAAAEAELPSLGVDLLAAGLGSAYRLAGEGKALLVPGEAELRAAGAPEGAQPMGQETPLFACLQMSREEEGGAVLPLFLSYDDCAAAVAIASAADAPEEPLEIAGLSLSSVVEQLASLDDPSSAAYSFVAPSASLKHIEAYVGKGVYWRPAE
ncbi:hypothetical protein AB1Y20_008918 [Prymnesium parvum]